MEQVGEIGRKVAEVGVAEIDARVVTPSASTSSRDAESEKRAMPQTSLSGASILAMPCAMRPAGPVMRIFSSLSTNRVRLTEPTLEESGLTLLPVLPCR